MVFNIHTNQRLLFAIPTVSYLILVWVCAIWPAWAENEYQKTLPEPPENELIERGFQLYRSFNCVTCHTQQIRGDERMAKEVDGVRTVPVLAADARFGREVASTRDEYAHQEPVLMGTERIGPDLLSVGKRLPDVQWHYWHLYNPQSVSPDSLMPPHRFLFTTLHPPKDREHEYESVHLIDGLGVPTGEKLWATPEAVALCEYLITRTRESLEAENGGR